MDEIPVYSLTENNEMEYQASLYTGDILIFYKLWLKLNKFVIFVKSKIS